jgi:flavin reductase (DIM6/NTAB) family NADH-FMN oxidoreductase RutF
MNDFRKAMIITAAPIVILSVLSLNSRFSAMLAAAMVLWGVSLIATVIFAIKGRRQVSAGIAVGASIGFAAFFVSCFASLGSF